MTEFRSHIALKSRIDVIGSRAESSRGQKRPLILSSSEGRVLSSGASECEPWSRESMRSASGGLRSSRGRSRTGSVRHGARRNTHSAASLRQYNVPHHLGASRRGSSSEASTSDLYRLGTADSGRPAQILEITSEGSIRSGEADDDRTDFEDEDEGNDDEKERWGESNTGDGSGMFVITDLGDDWFVPKESEREVVAPETLHHLARKGDTSTLRKFIHELRESKEDVVSKINEKDSIGKSCLFYAFLYKRKPMIHYLLRLGAEMISDAELESVSCLTPAAVAYPRPSTGFFRGYDNTNDAEYLQDMDFVHVTESRLSPNKLHQWEIRDREERARAQWALRRGLSQTAVPTTFQDRKGLRELYAAGLRTGLVQRHVSFADFCLRKDDYRHLRTDGQLPVENALLERRRTELLEKMRVPKLVEMDQTPSVMTRSKRTPTADFAFLDPKMSRPVSGVYLSSSTGARPLHSTRYLSRLRAGFRSSKGRFEHQLRKISFRARNFRSWSKKMVRIVLVLHIISSVVSTTQCRHFFLKRASSFAGACDLSLHVSCPARAQQGLCRSFCFVFALPKHQALPQLQSDPQATLRILHPRRRRPPG